MATYKVLQDIEAEDKLIGPLTLRQFVYAGISAATLYLCFILVSKHVYFLLPVFLPFAGVAGFFAWPFAGQQPTEVWALAKLRFLVKPRKRIWDQSGAKELVTVTAPKKIEVSYTNGLSQTEVHSRLRALADTIDSRGWAVKNVNVNAYNQPALVMGEPASDRLVSLETIPQEVPSDDIQPSDDMLDPQNNPVAHQFDTMIAASTKAHRQQILDRLRTNPPAAATPAPAPQQSRPATPPADYWFMSQPTPSSALSAPQGAVTFNAQLVTPGAPTQPPVVAAPVNDDLPADEEAALVQKLAEQQKVENIQYGHLHTIQPLSVQKQQQQQQAAIAAAQAKAAAALNTQPAPGAPKPPEPKVTQAPDAAILNLARNDDLDVATIARQAQKQRPEPPQDEVVISLH
ncbi:MAG TPA: PrgI family protein [Candidatus Saccharimonadales bacterium]|nr:PrgI family protein [Candidatus Saccharimonadales bacterium]